MKSNKYSKHIKASLALVAAIAMTGCSDSFLDQDPLSFYTPEAAYKTVAGLESALSQCDSQLKYMYVDGNWNMLTTNTHYYTTDIGLYAKTDASPMEADIYYLLSPTSGLGGGGDGNARKLYWNRSWDGVKYANTVLTYIDDVEGLDEEVKNEYKGRAYFHRAFYYYNLCLEFGDIPLVTKLATVAKVDYKSCSKEAIFQMLQHDLEFAVKWVKPQAKQKVWGVVNQEACEQLLIKVYLTLGEWKKAEAMATDLIENHGLALMTEPFGKYVSGNNDTWDVKRNVIWDLMRGDNVCDAANTETILPILNYNDQQFTVYMTMRSNGVHWSNGDIIDANGLQHPTYNYARTAKEYNPQLDWLRAIGRGIGCFRTAKHYNYGMWNYDGDVDWEDLRHNREMGNWVEMSDIRYNDPNSKYYGQPMQLYVTADTRTNDGALPEEPVGTLLCNDTIRSWYPTPLWKLYILDMAAEENPNANQFNGAEMGSVPSNGNIYLMRLAETYLLRAEAKFYQGDKSGAAQDVNVVRKRAHAKKMFSEVTIGDILDERARELYLEEWRQTEMCRISWCLARSGKPDEWGNIYSLENWDKQEGVDLAGGSYWYQRCVRLNLFNHGPIVSKKEINYQIGKQNLFWPVPQDAINANFKAPLRQNYGYTGYDPNVFMFTNWEEAVADEI